MSKELTEQYRDGTLGGGWYFLEFENGSILPVYYCGFNREFEFSWDWKISEVLAPMPTYDQFSQMVKKVEKYMDMANKYMNKYNDELKKVERLEQLLESETLAKQEGVEIVAELEYRLKEAENIILLYFKNTQNATYQSLGMNDGYYKKAYMHTVAKEYLEKYGVEK